MPSRSSLAKVSGRVHLAALLAVGLVVATVTATPCPAQETEPVQETVDVQLVVVDVFATDQQGHPVTDLSREDFRVEEDGSAVDISQFSGPGTARLDRVRGGQPEELATAPLARSPATIVLFVDTLHTNVASRQRALGQLADFVKHQLAPDDRVMVARYDGSVEVVQPLTSDHSAVLDVLRDRDSFPTNQLRADLSTDRILRVLADRQASQTLAGNVRAAGDACTDIGYIARSHAEQVYSDVAAAVEALRQFVVSLGGVPGRKVLLHVSDGLPLVAGQEAYRYAASLCDGTAAAGGNEDGVNTALFGAGRYTRWVAVQAEAEILQYNTGPLWEQLAANANSYQVSLYPLQAGGLTTLRSSSTEEVKELARIETEGRMNLQDTLTLLASRTGGRAALDTNNLTPDLERVGEDLDQAYQLAYIPPTPADGKRHAIKVEVSQRRGLRLRYRQGYLSKDEDSRIADGLLTSVVHRQGGNPLGVRLAVQGSQRTPEGVLRATVRILLPMERLTLVPGTEAEGRVGQFTVFAVTRDHYGRLSPVGRRSRTVKTENRPDLPPFVYDLDLPLLPGANDVGIAVRDDLGREVSFVTRTVTVEQSKGEWVASIGS